MKLKETLNLGKTAFPMRAGLPNKEPIWQKEWEDAKMYQRRQELNQGKPHFTLHDGPPYANGNIHVGHAMNKISKDIIVRSKSMSGFYAPYVPGWDTHGLPIEQVLAKQGVKRKELDRAEYLKMCRDYALSQVDKQREDFKRLGVSADWDNPYVTLTPDYEAAQIRVFGGMAKKGYIYQGAKPVYWSWSSESALAEAEIEYHDLVSTSLYYANKVKDGKGVLDTDTYIVVWTTTPFTVTASRGLTVGADIEYVLVKPAGENRKFVVASELLNSLSEKFGWTDVEVLQSYRGEELNQIVTEHPWDTEVDELVILGKMLVLILKVSSTIKWLQLLWKNSVICSLLKKKSHTHTHLTGVRRNQSSGVLCHNGLPLFLNSVKRFWMRLKKLNSILSGVKFVFTT